jgi:hypothetical protein
MEQEETKTEATTVTNCKTCKKGMNKNQWGLLILGLYMIGTTIYGTIAIIKDIISIF